MSNNIDIRELRPEEFTIAIEMIARGMRDNPLHIQALGSDAPQRIVSLKRMFGNVLPLVARKGVLLGAFNNGELVGVAGMVSPGNCQPSVFELVRLAPKICSAVGLRSFGNVGRWLMEWKRHDPAELHWHIGPVAVDAHLQGAGIGSIMMAEHCARLDRENAVGYLETDKNANVAFYEKFGFRTIGESNVLDVPNWYMRRLAEHK